MTGIDRRRLTAVLAGLAALPFVGRGRASGRAAFASARFGASGAAVALLDADGAESATQALPERGHGLAIAPDGRRLVVVARRPGRWALVLSTDDLAPLARLALPAGRHFYGHGCFSADGQRFFTTENDTDGGDGIVGVWDATAGFERIAEWRSGGVGPHDLALAPDGRRLIVANGGIRTHPDSGRDMLNRDTMQPTLAALSLDDGSVVERVDLGAELRLASIRHLAVAVDGEVVFGCQFEGDKSVMPPLVGAWRPGGGAARLWEMPDAALARLDDYVGSVALDRSGTVVAATSPRGGTTAFFARGSGRFLGLADLADVCGVAAAGDGFLLTSGAAGMRRTGAIGAATRLVDPQPTAARSIWDNHLAAFGDRRQRSAETNRLVKLTV